MVALTPANNGGDCQASGSSVSQNYASTTEVADIPVPVPVTPTNESSSVEIASFSAIVHKQSPSPLGGDIQQSPAVTKSPTSVTSAVDISLTTPLAKASAKKQKKREIMPKAITEEKNSLDNIKEKKRKRLKSKNKNNFKNLRNNKKSRTKRKKQVEKEAKAKAREEQKQQKLNEKMVKQYEKQYLQRKRNPGSSSDSSFNKSDLSDSSNMELEVHPRQC